MKNNCPFGINVSKLLMAYSDLLKNRKSALDIGCANGSNSVYLDNLGLNVTAVDKDIPKNFKSNGIVELVAQKKSI